MTTLIQVQEEAISLMMQPRTSEKRHAKWRASVREQYVLKVIRLWGASRLSKEARTNALSTWKDVLDMWRLRTASEE